MKIVIHAGAHYTDEDRLITSLAANRTALDELGTAVPNPATYRKLLRDMMQADESTGLAEGTRDVVMDSILERDSAETNRLVLSNYGFFGTPRMVMSSGNLYPAAEDRLASMGRIFAGDEVELFFGLCNPATFLPAVFAKSQKPDFASFMRGVDPRFVRWSEMLARLRATYPDLPITVWCNEDLPLIWAEVLREMGGFAPDAEITGEFALLEEIMAPEGMTRFKSYITSHPGMSEAQKRRVIAAFVDKFALEDALEQELDLPGWTEELVDELSDLYDADIEAIEAIPDIDLIAP